MSWLEPVSTFVTAAELANKAAASSQYFIKQIRRIGYRIKNGDVVIPIFGAGGVGKSTMGEILAAPEYVQPGGVYDESWIPERIKLPGDIPAQFLVAPGQIARADRHWPEILREVGKKSAIGIINVVSDGFHSFVLNSYQEHDLFKQGMTIEAFMSAYTDRRRSDEVDMLKKLLSGMAGLSQPLWMITVVNKEDLWWARKSEVRARYENGPYGTTINEARAAFGARNFQHEFVPASLAVENFAVGNDLLSLTAAGYDTARHFAGLQTLFDKLGALVEEGAP